MKILNSEAVLGLWNLSPSGFHKQLTAEEGRLLIKAAWRMGIRTFDTAFSYADADSILHRALKEINGTDAAVISKVMPVPTLRRKAETSLRRLGIESFAVLLLHWPSSPDDVRRSLDELTKLKEEGKEERLDLYFHKQLMSDLLPLSIGGGIGQSRLCMLLLQKAHIGEIQASIWPEQMRKECAEAGIPLI